MNEIPLIWFLKNPRFSLRHRTTAVYKYRTLQLDCLHSYTSIHSFCKLVTINTNCSDGVCQRGSEQLRERKRVGSDGSPGVQVSLHWTGRSFFIGVRVAIFLLLKCKMSLKAAFRIRIHRTGRFLGLRYSEIRIRIRIRILPSSSKNCKKNLYFYCFVTSLWLFIFEEWCKCTFKK